MPEISSGGKTYVVAEAGSSFEVAVTWHPNAAPLSKGRLYVGSIKVDCQDVGYSKHMCKVSVPATFRGFLKAGDSQGCAYQSFVFAKPRETEAKQATGLNFVEGTIKAQFTPAEYTGEQRSHERYQGPAAANNSIAKLPEGKKFFLAPSLTTGKGELKEGPGFTTRKVRYIQGPVVALELRYETAPTLQLRGVLREDNPQHRAILQRFPETAHKEEQEVENNENEREAYNAGAAAAGAAAVGRKRRRDAQQRQQDELIDLTKVAAEGDEVLASKAANKVLECDLTGEDEGEGPHWRAVKKEVHRVA